MNPNNLTTKERCKTARSSFEDWIRRQWHPDFRTLLDRNVHGAYANFDLQQAWTSFQAGWRRGRL